ncbi:hypothetical protein JR316_0012416 [Psilocybe cubensis]|uniref:AB hydrolase-1 domain-containing protein n=2 Tax=Psilocybe cubensis TaxID=181762 RepID=A0A8H7XPL1_PSICU|nr:hypothetical protein JR316_0012416 [Psilocybe cubensis]KAH9475305.1 hypothetical protein JR316_0012416 [Psilocybe cubensis]
MSTLTLANGITYHYTDSGQPIESQYKTLILIHGHSFNSGIFRKLLPLAPSQALRLICIDRREYNGSTPFTSEELRIIKNGNDEERASFLAEQGLLIALFIDGLIQNLALPIHCGGAISGWSLGNLYSLAMINAIDHPKLPQDVRERLKVFLWTYIIWEIPSYILGIESPPGSYVPLWDYDLPEEDRGPVFGTYISSFFDHGTDVLAGHNIPLLNHRNPTPGTSTIEKMTQEEILSSTNFLVGPKCDTIVLEPPYYGTHRTNLRKALLDDISSVDKWGMDVWHIYGDSCSWNVVLSPWILEEQCLKANKKVHFRTIADANHFLMWEDPERAIAVLKECLV